MTIRNFLFHRVSDETDMLWPPMKPSLFSEVIQYLTTKYSIVPLEGFLNDPVSFRSKKSLATILFDDGYKDNIEYAAPVLTKFNCPASFYVVTDCINRNVPTWTYVTDEIFQKTNRNITLDFSFVPEKFKFIKIKDGIGMVKGVKPWLKSLSNTERKQIINEIIHQCDDVVVENNKMMSWDDIRQLDSHGFVIGSHSHTHPMLASLQNESEIAEELLLSASIIEQEIRKPPFTISYPIGSYDQRVTSLAQKTGYKYGLAVEQRFFRFQNDDLFAIPRVELYQEPWWKQHLRISGIYGSVKRVIS